MNSPKRIHFTGICGVGTGALAIALHNAGFIVTGSDKGFFPPVSTALTAAGVHYYAGWHPEKMTESGSPDLIVAGGIGTGSENPELILAKEKSIPIISFAEAVGRYIVKPNSIVCAGTWGKTTSSALLSHILEHGKMDPSYFYGGVAVDRPSGAIRASGWSVVEGDEYKSAIWDERPKFAHYKPTHLLLTAIKWDHADMYPTEGSYFDAFRSLIKAIPENGMIAACIDTDKPKEILAEAGRDFISYGKSEDAVYRYGNVVQTENGLAFDIVYHGKTYNIKSPMLGAYNAENIAGCFALAHSIGIAPGDISDAIASFRGMKRRLEKRYDHRVTVIDDIAHSPEKAKSVLETVRGIYKGKVIAVYEPNTGNRTPESKPSYRGAFRDADEVIIPRLTKLKVDPENPDKTFDGQELADTISQSHNNVYYSSDDDKLVEHLIADRKEGDAIVFLGSHGFRGMIEETVKRIAQA